MTAENMSAQWYAALIELEQIDDLFCDILQDHRRYVSPEVERYLTQAIDRLRAWREKNGMIL